MLQPSEVRLLNGDALLGLSNTSLGVFVKLLIVGSRMPIRGVFVNGSVLDVEALRAEICFDGDDFGKYIAELVERGLLVELCGVYRIAEPAKYFKQTTYSDSVIAKVVGVLRHNLPAVDIEAVTVFLQEAGRFKKEVSVDDIRQRLIALYARFADRKALAQSYVGCFRTKQQIERGLKMHLPRHLSIVTELLQIYESEKFMFNGREYKTSRGDIEWAMDTIVKRGLVGLRNHNYLKVMLSNRTVNQSVRSQMVRQSHEGY